MQAKKAQAKQRATKKANTSKEMQPKKHKQNKEGSLGGGSSVALLVAFFWRRVKCRTFGRFLGAGSEVALFVGAKKATNSVTF